MRPIRVSDVTPLPPTEAQSTHQLRSLHRAKLIAMRDELTRSAGVALRIAEAIGAVLERGGTLNAQPQMNFLTGSQARVTKDWGIIEHLQINAAAAQRRTPK